MAAALNEPWHGVETAGRVCLSFVNTLDWRGRDQPTELLVSYGELLRWALTACALTAGDARALVAEAAAHPRRAAARLDEAIALRETLAAALLAHLDGEAPARALLDRLSRAFGDATAARRLVAEDGAISWRWRRARAELERPLWAVALDASSLLTGEAITRVRRCADAECGWLFLDTSKNRSRRWCSMESCGNRNKARSFYRRASGRSAR